MKNCQKIEQARKQAGIADDIRTESFVGWKRAGMSVRKGEKAVFSVKLSKPNPAGGFKTVTDYFFTEKQVEPITARPSRRGKDTAPVSESAPAVAVPSVAVKETETAPAPVAVELAPVVPVVAPSNPTRPLIKAGDDQNGTYFGIASDGSLVTIATYESHDLSIERVDPSVSVQTETAPAVDAPADPDPVEEEEPAPVLSEHLKQRLSKSDRPLPYEYTEGKEYLIAKFKREDIRRLVRSFNDVYNEYVAKPRLADAERKYTQNGIAPQTAETWRKVGGYQLKKDAIPCYTHHVYFTSSNARNTIGTSCDTVNYYAWDQVEPIKQA